MIKIMKEEFIIPNQLWVETRMRKTQKYARKIKKKQKANNLKSRNKKLETNQNMSVIIKMHMC